MTLLWERIEQVRKQVRARLRKKWPPKLSDAAIAAAEEHMWHDTLRKRADSSHKTLEELPDGGTVDLYLTRAADESILGESLIRAMATALDKRDGIAQRVRARSRGRREVLSEPQTTSEAGTAVKGQWLAENHALVLVVVVVVLVVYVVERTGTLIKQ